MIQRQLHSMPVSVYYSFASEDQELLQELEKHLSLLRRQKVIVDWHSNSVLPGSETKQEALEHLKNAELILLLLSKDFITSDTCYEFELPLALQAQKEGRAHVVPIVVRPCDMQIPSLAALDYLPSNRKAITLWSDRDDAFTDIVLGIRKNLLELCGPVDLLAQEFSNIERKHVILTVQQLTSRSRFLSLVHETWIVGMLQPSLRWGMMLTPGLELFPSALTQAWPNLLHVPQSLSVQKDIFRAYEDASGDLLILGEPGAGKTTLLLQLVSALLERAQQDEQQPMPVVFTLASWAIKRLPLDDWMIEELQKRYRAPRELAKQWLEEEQILPLLDGLDEVTEERRAGCIVAINQYRREHYTIPLVVCSRKQEYFAQDERVELQRAILVQPLSQQQIDDCISKAGERLVPLHHILQQDPLFRELLTSPLLLNMSIFVYQSDDFAKIDSQQTQKAYYQELLKVYAYDVVDRYQIKELYASEDIYNWLAALAWQMKQHKQTAFYIERLDMSWIREKHLQQVYRIGTVLLCVLLGGVFGGIVCAWVGGLFGGNELKVLLSSTIGAVSFGFIGGFMCSNNPNTPTVAAFVWSWRVFRKDWFIIVVCMLTGAFIGGADTQLRLVGALGGGLFGGLFGGVIGLLNSGLSVVMPEAKQAIKPNQEIWRSVRYCLLVIIICAIFGVFFAIIGSRYGLLLVSGFGFAGALGLGGLVSLEHFVLRVLLKVSGQMPWDVPRFLDAAVDCGLMRKVGSGYMFMHALLLDYFAEQGEEI